MSSCGLNTELIRALCFEKWESTGFFRFHVAMASFVSPFPISSVPHQSSSRQPLRRPIRWRMTSTEAVQAPTPAPRRENALTIPDFVTETPLIRALYRILGRQQDASMALHDVVVDNVEWDMPLYSMNNKTDMIETLNGFLDFTIQPTFMAHSCEQEDHELRFSWTLSFIYPLPWRPAVSIGGRTVAKLKNGKITEIIDEWACSPLKVLKQTLPTVSDVMWLFPAPHAQTDAGIRKVLKRERGYDVVEMWPRVELRMREKVINESERRSAMKVPVLPKHVFEGGLRKKELYWTSTPVGVRNIGDDTLEWSIGVPGGLCGSAKIGVKKPQKEGVWIEERDVERFAIVRVSGYVEEEKIKEVAQMVGGEEVWVRSYDAKIGFNEKGLLSMAMYGATRFFWRTSEICVKLD